MTTKNHKKPTIAACLDAATLIETAVALLTASGNGMSMQTDTQVSTLIRIGAELAGLEQDEVYEAVMQKAHHDRNYEMHRFKRGIGVNTPSEIVDVKMWERVRKVIRGY